jgi:superfamily II DNA or RNA helicase/CRISPR/Cas system-associated exonuclease Cas4 (RecB family)
MIQFNLSASSLGMYLQSQLQFYYEYIRKSLADTEIVEVYGLSGSCVHEILEDYTLNKIWDVEMQFAENWNKKQLNKKLGLNNQPLNYQQYLECVKLGIVKLEHVYKGKQITEEKFVFPFINNDKCIVNLKGFIDLIIERDDEEVILVDFKTSNSIEEGAFDNQAKMYYLLYHKKYNKLPIKIIFEYLKLNKTREYSFNLEDVIKFEKYLYNVIEEIISKGNDIKQYELGEWDNIFNQHRLKCEKEKFKRENEQTVSLTIKNNRIYFNGDLPENLKKFMIEKYSYEVQNANFTPQYQSGKWDGMNRMYKYNSLPYGYINDLKKLIIDYNEYFKTNYIFKIFDNRNKDILNKTYKTKFEDSGKQLRNYQKDVVEKMIESEVGIMYMGTGLGKTFTTAEIIKKINKRTLFIVNTLELVEQTHEEFEDMLKTHCGKMSEGNLDIDKQITIASVQTIYRILKRGDDTSKQLNNYLFNVGCCIWDECQNVGNSNYYKIINLRIVNCKYIFGLSGSPFRNDEATLEMNGIVGFPVVNYSTKWGEENGWLCPTKGYFIRCKQNQQFDNYDYTDKYDLQIVRNDNRNGIIIDIVNKFKHKKILILTKIIEHGKILNGLIPGSFLINSKVDIKNRKNNMEQFKGNEGGVMIAGVKIAGAGLDIPTLDVLIIACAHKSAIDSIQTIGRVKRLAEGKKYGYLIDFMDSGYFGGASRERMKTLIEYGNNIDVVDGVDKIVVD